jgi:glycopeptide antibiotics resistance protein
LFLPFGAALALLGRGPLVTAALGCLTSTSIELAQLLVPGRTSATDDIILNTVGALLGYLASRGDVTRRRTVGK